MKKVCCLLLFWAAQLLTPVYAYESSKPLAELDKELEKKVIALITADVEITTIKAGGVRDANVIWSTDARNNLILALKRLFSKSDDKASFINALTARDNDNVGKFIALQSIVNLSILAHIQSPLPSKQKFDWSVGDDFRMLKQYLNADFGLFVFIRSGFSSVKTKAGYQTGFVSLVNLTNGNTVWFEHHKNRIGDFRNSEKAWLAVQRLMKNFPAIGEILR